MLRRFIGPNQKKIVILIHYHPSTFATEIEDFYDLNKYKIYGFFNSICHAQLGDRAKYFEKIFCDIEYSHQSFVHEIDKIREINNFNSNLYIVNTWEEDTQMCGMLNKHYGLSLINYDRFVNKVMMKDIVSSQDIVVPQYKKFYKNPFREFKEVYLDSLAVAIGGFPIFTKPIDKSGSFGTKLIKDKAEFEAWANETLKKENENYEFEVDEYLDESTGWKLYEADTCWHNGKALSTQVCEYSRGCFHFVKGHSMGSIIIYPTHPVAIKIATFAERALMYLGNPGNGWTHTEIFAKGNDLRFLETARRPGGAWISKVYKESLGINILSNHIKLQINPELKMAFNFKQPSAFIMWPLREGTVIGIEKDIPIKSEKKEILIKVQEGQQILPGQVKQLMDSAALIFFSDLNMDIVKEDFARLSEKEYFPFVMQSDLESRNTFKK